MWYIYLPLSFKWFELAREQTYNWCSFLLYVSQVAEAVGWHGTDVNGEIYYATFQVRQSSMI
jgi:hypothetical protein